MKFCDKLIELGSIGVANDLLDSEVEMEMEPVMESEDELNGERVCKITKYRCVMRFEMNVYR